MYCFGTHVSISMGPVSTKNEPKPNPEKNLAWIQFQLELDSLELKHKSIMSYYGTYHVLILTDRVPTENVPIRTRAKLN